MKTFKFIKQTALTLALAAVVCTGCDKKEETVRVTGVTLEKKTLTLQIGGSEKLVANVAPDNATERTVTWSSEKEEIAAVDPSTGKVTAVAVGETTITVTTKDGGKTDKCVVTVVDKTTPDVPVESVTVTPKELTLEIDQTQILKADILPAEATNKNVRWESDAPAIATVDAATGEVKAIAVGQATITATADNGKKSGNCIVTVEEPRPSITMTSDAKDLLIKLWGEEGTATIDWGEEGVEPQTVTLKPERQPVFHSYQSAGSHTIVIKGNVIKLNCDGIELKSLDVSKNPLLIDLVCGFNQLTKLDVSKNLALKNLNFPKNQLTEINVSNNTALVELFFESNNLTELDVTNNVNLEYLCFENNKIAAVKLLTNIKLKCLRINDNGMNSIDVSKNTALEVFEADGNTIGFLNLNDNIALRTVSAKKCGTNMIVAGNCTQLENLWLGGNNFSYIDLSKNTALKHLYLNDCKLTSFNATTLTKLEILDLIGNKMEDGKLNEMFNTLHSDNPGKKYLYVSGNPGVDACDKQIAIDKGWVLDVK